VSQTALHPQWTPRVLPQHHTDPGQRLKLLVHGHYQPAHLRLYPSVGGPQVVKMRHRLLHQYIALSLVRLSFAHVADFLQDRDRSLAAQAVVALLNQELTQHGHGHTLEMDW
jgi:hypothetical protein